MKRISPGEWPATQPLARRIPITPQRQAVLDRYNAFEAQHGPAIARYLSVTEVAHYLGLAGPDSLERHQLPEPDAIIGKIKGWSPSSIEEWNKWRHISQGEGAARSARFLSLTEVSEFLGLASVKSMAKYKLPEPDALIGKIKGWLPSTIEQWNATRSRRGRPRTGAPQDT